MATSPAAIAPLLCGIPLLLGAMGYAGVPLGIATSMFTAVTVGVAVDFSIHISHVYNRRRRDGLDHCLALEVTLSSEGRALRWNALVLGAGILVLAVSELKPNRSLGLLLSAAILVCCAMTLLLFPKLLDWRATWLGGRRDDG